MSVHRYRTAGPDTDLLRNDIEAGLTVSPTSGGFEVDIMMVDDSLLPDLDIVMAQLGYTFVSSSPATPRITHASEGFEWNGSAPPPVAGLGAARMYFDSVSKQMMLSEDGGNYRPFGATGQAGSVSGLYACPAGVTVGDAVYLSGAGTVDQADSDDNTKQPLIGVVLSKPTPTSCIVVNYGEAPIYVGLTSGSTYYLGVTPGTITTTAPTTPGNIVQRMGFAKSPTTLVVMTDRDWTEIT